MKIITIKGVLIATIRGRDAVTLHGYYLLHETYIFVKSIYS